MHVPFGVRRPASAAGARARRELGVVRRDRAGDVRGLPRPPLPPPRPVVPVPLPVPVAFSVAEAFALALSLPLAVVVVVVAVPVVDAVAVAVVFVLVLAFGLALANDNTAAVTTMGTAQNMSEKNARGAFPREGWLHKCCCAVLYCCAVRYCTVLRSVVSYSLRTLR